MYKRTYKYQTAAHFFPTKTVPLFKTTTQPSSCNSEPQKKVPLHFRSL